MIETTGPAFLPQRNDAAERILHHLLLRGGLSRRQLKECTGLSAPSITNYTRDLTARGLLASDEVRVSGSKRPVSLLRVNPACGSAIVLRTEAGSVAGELISLDGNVRAEITTAGGEHNQRGVLDAVSRTVAALLRRARRENLTPLLAGLAIAGSVAPDYGIVFGLDGVPGWEPCQPGEIMPVLREIPLFMVWPQVSCKAAGLALARREDHRLAYLDLSGNTLRLASMQQGELVLGRYGTVSALFHRSAARNGNPCYCGRRGCLVRFVESGRATEKMILTLVRRLATELDVRLLGIEGPPATERLERQVAGRCLDTLVRVTDSPTLTASGLRFLAARAALSRILRADRPAQTD